MRRNLLALLGFTLMCALPDAASACPLCKEAMGETAPPEQAELGRGLSRSILLMIGMPLALFGVGTLAVVRAARRGSLPEL